MSFLVLLVLAQPVLSKEPVATPEQLASTFERFCLRTHVDRVRFDAEIASAPELRKVSSPSLFSKVEFNRRWKIGSIELAFLDGPPPAGRSCSVTAGARGGFDGAVIVSQIAKSRELAQLTLVEGEPGGFARWVGTTSNEFTVIINNRPNSSGFGDAEIILRPPSN